MTNKEAIYALEMIDKVIQRCHSQGMTIPGTTPKERYLVSRIEMIEQLINHAMRISPQPTMPEPETNCPRIDGSKLSAHDQVTRDEFDQGAM